MKNSTIKVSNSLPIISEISPIEKKIRNVKISSPENMQEATEFLSQCNRILDRITEEREKITKPMNEALKEVRARYKPAETLLEELIAHLRNEMRTYQTAELARQKEQEAKILARVEKGSLKAETAIERMNSLKTPDSTISTATGSIRFREDKILKILDLSLIPREYFDLNESKLLKSLKNGAKIPGADVEIVQTPINSR